MKFALAVVCAVLLMSAITVQGQADCPQFCTLEYRPLCATDGATQRTFSNNCDMTSTACRERKTYTKVSDGQCPS